MVKIMSILQITGLGLVTVVFSVLLKEYHAPSAIFLPLVFGVIVFGQIFEQLAVILDTFRQVSARAGINTLYLAVVLKVIGISYIAEFTAQICRDSGNTAIAAKIELAAKIIILTMMLPILSAILQNILDLIA